MSNFTQPQLATTLANYFMHDNNRRNMKGKAKSKAASMATALADAFYTTFTFDSISFSANRIRMSSGVSTSADHFMPRWEAVIEADYTENPPTYTTHIYWVSGGDTTTKDNKDMAKLAYEIGMLAEIMACNGTQIPA